MREKWVSRVQPRPDAADRRGVHHFGQSRAPFRKRQGAHQDITILIGGLYGPCAVHVVFPDRLLLVTFSRGGFIPSTDAADRRGVHQDGPVPHLPPDTGTAMDTRLRKISQNYNPIEFNVVLANKMREPSIIGNQIRFCFQKIHSVHFEITLGQSFSSVWCRGD